MHIMCRARGGRAGRCENLGLRLKHSLVPSDVRDLQLPVWYQVLEYKGIRVLEDWGIGYLGIELLPSFGHRGIWVLWYLGIRVLGRLDFLPKRTAR